MNVGYEHLKCWELVFINTYVRIGDTLKSFESVSRTFIVELSKSTTNLSSLPECFAKRSSYLRIIGQIALR